MNPSVVVRPRAPLRRAVAALLALLALLCGARSASASARAVAPGVTVTMISAPQLTLDSNKPCTEGPRAAYVAFRVTNTSGAALTNLRATISGFANGITLGGGQAAGQYVGQMAAGTSRVLYWFVAYPCTFGNSATLTVSVTDATAGSTTGTGTVTTSSMVSAQAGGVLMNGVLGPGAVVGQIIEFDVAYEFGGVSAGDSYNLQVAGNQSFNAACFQLMKQQVISSLVDAAPAGDTDRPFFAAAAKQTGQGHAMTVRFFFKYLCANVSSTARPYGNQFSGGQLKYSSNYETFVGPTLPIATNAFAVSKTASPDRLASGGTVTYTVVVSNTSSFTAELDSIVDALPGGVTFSALGAGSVATASPSGSTIVFRSALGSAFTLAPGGSVTVTYTASATSTPGQYVNTASAVTGVTPLSSDSDTVTVGTADVAVAKTGQTSVVVGDTLRYAITVSNNAATAKAYRVVVTDTLPAGVTFVSATRSATVSGRVVTWPAIDSLLAGESRTDTVVVLAPTSLGTLVNVAASTSNTVDPTGGNNNGSAPESRVTTTVTSSVDVTPKGLPSPLQRLPGKYAQVFTVVNASPSSGSFDLIARLAGTAATPGVFVTVDSLTGSGITTRVRPDSVRLTLAAKTSYAYTVWYTVPAGDTAVNVEYLRARAAADTTLRSEGWVDLRRVFPTLSLSKQVSPAGTLAPGTDLTYTMAFSNVGEYAAEGVVVADSVPPQTFFKAGSPAQALPAGITATVQYSADGGATWTYTPVSGGCGAPSGYDGCVRRVRWLLAGSLPAGAPASSGTVSFVARIR
ncbi:MAG TPA: hypothetical protein VHG91_19020 [Longimicrobium sp.]|nr:hypothetical protein [Longimicrobium sp.]